MTSAPSGALLRARAHQEPRRGHQGGRARAHQRVTSARHASGPRPTAVTKPGVRHPGFAIRTIPTSREDSMSTTASSRDGLTDRDTSGAVTRRDTTRRLSTETKHSSKTSGLYAYIAATVGVLLAGLLTKAGDGHDDRLQAHEGNPRDGRRPRRPPQHAAPAPGPHRGAHRTGPGPAGPVVARAQPQGSSPRQIDTTMNATGRRPRIRFSRIDLDGLVVDRRTVTTSTCDDPRGRQPRIVRPTTADRTLIDSGAQLRLVDDLS